MTTGPANMSASSLRDTSLDTGRFFYDNGCVEADWYENCRASGVELSIIVTDGCM